MMNFALMTRLATDIPMIRPDALSAWLNAPLEMSKLLEPVAGEHPNFVALRESLKDKPLRLSDGVAIIPVSGTLAVNPSTIEMMFAGMQDSRDVSRHINQAAEDSTCTGIVLDISSPGGMHTGGPEMADAVRRASMSKPVVAFTDSQACSLAYMLASQATEIVASQSATVGSIGAYVGFLDTTRMMEAAGVKMEVFRNSGGVYKTAGLSGTSLNEKEREYIQGRVDGAFNQFKALVKSARPQVQDEAMRGQLFWAGDAKDAGLIDRIGDKSFAVATCRFHARKRQQTRTVPA